MTVPKMSNVFLTTLRFESRKIDPMTLCKEGIMSHYTFFQLAFLMTITSCAIETKYPKAWWHDGEILPQEVTISKQNELGILLNDAATPFYYKAVRYGSVEGFWQMMKYPDPEMKNDPRNKFQFPFTRQRVANMDGLKAKLAGEKADYIMKTLNIDWVTFEARRMPYCSKTPGDHFYLIREAMRKKVRYNRDVRRLLLATGKLELKPEHPVGECKAPEWKYFELWEEIRKEIMRSMTVAPGMHFP